MAFKQTLIHRMFTICNNKFSTQTLRNCRISPAIFTPPNPDTVAPDPGDDTVFLHRNPTTIPDILRSRSENIIQKLKQMDSTRNRIRLDGITSPPPPPEKVEMTVADAKKILRVTQIEKLKAKLRSNNQNNISYDEFVKICVDECSNLDQGLDLAKVLDDSGSVIVLGNVVFLKPQQVSY